MRLDLNCITCNINQVIRIADLIRMETNEKEIMMQAVLKYLSKVDYSKCNPEVMRDTWKIIMRHIKSDNPYQEIKKYYNTEILKMTDAVEQFIESSYNPFDTALKVAIAGNLIDFAAKHQFNLELLKEKIMNIQTVNLAADDSKRLYDSLRTAESLMYLGDNCGEICLDKLFIKYIKKEFPNITVYFGVRGKAIINDVTYDDAQMVNMQEAAEIVDNGDGSLGTVITRVSEAFREKFYGADVVIAKGQGNYESLSEVNKKNIFHLFMAKCEPVSKMLGVKCMSIVCIENRETNHKIVSGCVPNSFDINNFV